MEDQAGPITSIKNDERNHTKTQKSKIGKLRAAVDIVGFSSFIHAQSLLSAAEDKEAILERDDSHLATPWGTARSLINAAVSGGVLALAYQIPRTGSVLLVLLLLLSGWLLYESMMMLFKSSLHYGTSSYTGTVRAAWGKKAALGVTISLGFGQYGILIGYANVLKDTIPWVIQYVGWGCVESDLDCELPTYLSNAFIISVLMAILIIPVSLRSNPDVFAKISFTTFIHFFLFLILVLYGAVLYWPSNISDEVYTNDTADGRPIAETVYPEESSVFQFGGDAVVAIAILAFAMEAHTTAMPILHGTKIHKDETKEGKIHLISIIVAGSMMSVFVYYVWIAICCYIAFGDSVADNCLTDFPDSSVFAMIIRCTYAFELATSIPIYVYSMRRDITAAFLDVEGGQAEMDKIESENKFRTYAITLVLLISSTILGLLGSLSLILGFTGAIVTSMNTYVFPALLYRSANTDDKDRILCIPFAVFGIGVSVIALYQQIANLMTE